MGMQHPSATVGKRYLGWANDDHLQQMPVNGINCHLKQTLWVWNFHLQQTSQQQNDTRDQPQIWWHNHIKRMILLSDFSWFYAYYVCLNFTNIFWLCSWFVGLVSAPSVTQHNQLFNWCSHVIWSPAVLTQWHAMFCKNIDLSLHPIDSAASTRIVTWLFDYTVMQLSSG